MRIFTTIFDKNVISNDKYRHSSIKAMSDKSNLSKILSSLIGFFPDFTPDSVIQNRFRGVFERVAHQAYSFRENEEEMAFKLLRDLLSLDSGINCIINGNTFEDCNIKNDLIIDQDNIEAIFNKMVECVKCNKCLKRISFKFENKLTPLAEEKTRLFLPSIIFRNGDRFFKSLFQEIATHRICTHAPINTALLGKIVLQGYNIGTNNDCAYLLILIDKNKENINWPVDKQKGNLKPPHQLKRTFKESKLNLYCDYLVVAPKDSDYQFISIGGFLPKNDDFIFKQVDNEIISVRDNFSLIIKKKDNQLIICNDIDPTPSLKINIAKKPIIHLFAFNNHQKTIQV